MLHKESIINKLSTKEGYLLTVTKKLPLGVQLRFANGAIVVIYNNGTVLAQGKLIEQTKQILGLS